MSAAPIVFRHQSSPHTLAWGESYTVRRAGGFRDTSKAELMAMVDEIDAGRPWREVVARTVASRNDWLHRIVASPLRTAFFEAVLPAGTGPALDIGAGWGQIARPLARTRPVVALEPVEERMAFIRAAAKQDGVASQMAFLEVNYSDVEFSTPFEAITVIGVLEWAGTNDTGTDPQERQRAFLQKLHRELADGGVAVIGIENRVGLKYLLGCPDDHLGVPHIGALDAAAGKVEWKRSTGRELQSFTYSDAELTELLRSAGFGRVEFFGAFPDYKLPEQIVPLGVGGEKLNEWLLQQVPPAEHNGHNGTPIEPLVQTALHSHYRTLAKSGIAHHFVPSFFVRAWK